MSFSYHDLPRLRFEHVAKRVLYYVDPGVLEPRTKALNPRSEIWHRVLKSSVEWSGISKIICNNWHQHRLQLHRTVVYFLVFCN